MMEMMIMMSLMTTGEGWMRYLSLDHLDLIVVNFGLDPLHCWKFDEWKLILSFLKIRPSENNKCLSFLILGGILANFPILKLSGNSCIYS